jgi:putative RecB family exonuclease
MLGKLAQKVVGRLGSGASTGEEHALQRGVLPVAPPRSRPAGAGDVSRPIYSHSRLEAFESCALKYKFCYIDKIEKKEQGVEAFVGSRVHETLRKLYDDLLAKTPATLQELLDFYRAQWNKNWGPQVKIVRRGASAKSYFQYGEQCIRTYYERIYPSDRAETLETERKILFSLDAGGIYPMQGYVDRIARRADGTFEVHDYKTGRRAPTQQQADGDRQLGLYHIGVQALWPDARHVELVWHHLGAGTTLRSQRTPGQLVQLCSDTRTLIDHIESQREFPPHKSALCDWCEFRPECPAWR